MDPARLPFAAFPELVRPADVLELQRVPDGAGTAVPFMPPPVFLVIGYASHCHRSIELVSQWSAGGTILEWELGTDEYRITYRSLTDLLEALAELVAEDRLQRGDGFVLLAAGAELEKQVSRLEASEPHALYGDVRSVPTELESWPMHWLAASGVDLRDREPLGATHTVAELVSAAATGVVTGRVHGEVVRLAGTGGDRLAVVADRTGQLAVWCPARTSPWGPVHRRRFELELTMDSRLELHAAAALARDIRPLD